MLTFDIETVPTAAAMALPYPEADRSPPGSYKSEDAIARWRESDREKWEADRIKAYSLNPRLGRVVAIGTKLPMDEECLLARTESEEAGVLDEFWDTVRAYRTVAGWNSLGFDFPFLVRRSLILGVDLSGIDVPQYTRRYSYRPHFDAKMALLNWPSGYPAGEGLSEWATAFGFPAKSGHGSEVYAMFTEGRFEDLAAYCLDDVRATGAIARRIAPVFGVEVDDG